MTGDFEYGPTNRSRIESYFYSDHYVCIPIYHCQPTYELVSEIRKNINHYFIGNANPVLHVLYSYRE
jgi:hypothetical protein